MSFLDCGGRAVDLRRPAVMGILNVTPDSFSDGGIFLARDQAVRRAVTMAAEGADIIDIGGESTRPGAAPVSEQQELDRVLPVIEAVCGEIAVPISIDTAKPGVMRAAVAAGAGLINDVYALRAEGAMTAGRDVAVPVCLMHMQGQPRTMQMNPVYRDVVAEVRTFLADRIAACEVAGIPRERLLIDPGFGFGKTDAHNLELLRGLRAIVDLGVPVVVGLSRKSMIGRLLGLSVDQRLYASVALALLAVHNGAAVVRVHDVAPTVQALRMYDSIYRGTEDQ